MDTEKLDELRNYYDNTDTTDSMAGGTWENDVQDDPMVTTSLRLPKSVLDRIRTEARSQHMKPTALMRQWLEERQSGTAHIQLRLDRLEQAVFEAQNRPAMDPFRPQQRTGSYYGSSPRDASGGPSGEDLGSRTGGSGSSAAV